MTESNTLEHAPVELEAEKAAFHAQSRLLEDFINIDPSAKKVDVLKMTLQKGLELCAE